MTHLNSPAAVEPAARAPILALEKLDKRFGATHALKAVDLAFDEGEIHAIVGENGAGKSTLIKLLTGVHPRSSGAVYWRGKAVPLANPHEAIGLGINAVHQEVVLCPHLTVAGNIFLGDEEMRAGLLDHKRMVRDGQKLLDDLGFSLPADVILSSLTIGQQQLVATARAERRGARFLIFDEPTAYLTRQEAAALFTLIRRLKANGVTIVYISHRLEEVFELCDRVSVLRDGALVGTRLIGDTNEADLIALMINRTIEQIYYKDSIPVGAAILETEKLSGDGFRDISIRVREGEIVGLYGLIGAGRSEFVQSVFGRHPASSGRISWQGRDVSIRNERRAMDLGIALAPESRRDQGLCLNLGVGFNLNLPIFKRLSLGPLINGSKEVRAADRQIRDVQIKTAAQTALVSSLSGGNQQKVVIGKWLNHGAKLFIFDEPTVGVDVGTKAEIYRLLASLLKEGAGIIMISSYLPEVYELADTLHVFRGGSIVASHNHRDASHETILSEAIGV
ncbi:MAG: sugar ABC transporter ATP-binding protein [Roseiarcus sp.]|uniref:sugar ABC transporter ATP-binding protein n=1 Tax=Roseiarcus sp. TaxID=1969460 RepID=UPI003C624D61